MCTLGAENAVSLVLASTCSRIGDASKKWAFTATQKVREGSEEMLEGSEAVVQEMTHLNQLTNSITSSMREMTAGISQINASVQNVNGLAANNDANIQKLSVAVSTFKVE